MIHAICDFCGKDAGRSAFLLSLEPFQNFARYHSDNSPYGAAGPKKSYCMCQGCMSAMRLPNPYHDYNALQHQSLSYGKHFGNYTEEDIKADVRGRQALAFVPNDDTGKGGDGDAGQQQESEI